MKNPGVNSTLLLLIFLLPMSSSQGRDSDVIAALKNCARIEHSVTRSACYEALGTQVLKDEVPTDEVLTNEVLTDEVLDTAAPVTPADAVSAPPQAEAVSKDVLPDSLGGRDFADKAGVKEESSRGLVTSCKKAADRSWFYIFDSGQVWKQVDRRTRRHNECNFYVTISKDSFGYIMQIDDQPGKIRIDRRK